ncbi:Methylase involved in ubiquinone/menaquinone biosynthesis [Deinococcus hopiensis KR-140]|uniref:Methylase involved in ubiquinone/menaquinone biosynthesis n=2 Tax=Deinococcus TaxID=1298 RepID=A0A1W1UL71_9DEIO|nr:Methylase involved in ubiquinone/menaquinone biosynthesis [Deinococcus hopiensis KR-140]
MAEQQSAQERATFPREAAGILRARSLSADYRHLAASLRVGQRVMDVGCGTGAMTAGMAELVAPGEVTGLDANAALLSEAHHTHGHVQNLSFCTGDVYALQDEEAFDVVVMARVLQWLAHPRPALERMVKALKPGGRLFVLDYNHVKARLVPPPPREMLHFRERYLAWRAEAGMENEVADHVAEWMQGLGLTDVEVVAQHEITQRSDDDFSRRVRLWGDVARTRGHQVVAAGFVSEEERQIAVERFEAWAASDAEEQHFYLLSVVGTKPL